MKKAIVGIGVLIYIIGIVILAFSFIDLPHTTTEPYQVPNSSEILNESITVFPGSFTRMLNLTGGTSVHIGVEVTAGEDDIDFYVRDYETIYIAETRVTTLDRNWTVPLNRTYWFVYDNSLSWTSKNVTTIVTKHWTETQYREVIKYYPLIPYGFSYIGLILCSAGIGVSIFGFSFKEKELLIEKKSEMKCTKCGMRPATSKDGLCDQCRLGDVLNELAKRK